MTKHLLLAALVLAASPVIAHADTRMQITSVDGTDMPDGTECRNVPFTMKDAAYTLANIMMSKADTDAKVLDHGSFYTVVETRHGGTVIYRIDSGECDQ